MTPISYLQQMQEILTLVPPAGMAALARRAKEPLLTLQQQRLPRLVQPALSAL